jgi:hypothetical protein
VIEHWIEVEQHPRYLVSNYGQVYDRRSDRLVKQQFDRAGYKRVHLTLPTGRLTVSVHRLVAGSFYAIDPSEFEVNHIDGNKANNHIANLELCTRSENMRYAYAMGAVRLPNETRVRCVETGEEFRTIREAARAIGVSDHKSILRVLDKPQYKARGFHFERV